MKKLIPKFSQKEVEGDYEYNINEEDIKPQQTIFGYCKYIF
jgi:hypothetical protein